MESESEEMKNYISETKNDIVVNKSPGRKFPSVYNLYE